MTVRVAQAAPEHAAGLGALFDAASTPCHCRYWHFEGDKNAWLERCAFAPEVNRHELEADLAAGAPSGRGLVALDDAGVVVGWAKLAPRAAVPKLRRLSVYRALDLGDDDGVLSLACLLVHPEHRGRGIARALARAAVDVAREAGARFVEAYPVRAVDRIPAEEAYRGTVALLEEVGYEEASVRAGGGSSMPWEIGATAKYPVLRAATRG